MRLSIRVSITALILTVLTGAVTAVAISSYRSARQDARDLSQQIVEQTLRRIELRTRTLLDTATGQGDLGRATIESQELIRPDRPAARGFPALSTYFASTLGVYPELSYFGYALEATGEYCVAERKADGAIEVREYALDEQGQMGVSFYRMGAGTRELARTEAWDGYDPRVRPFYIPAKQAGVQVWTDTYAFWDTTATTNSSESREIPGVSCVTPAFATVQGRRMLTGVIDTDFDLYVLCDFLRDLGEEVPGITFIVEQRSDGTERAIAHPDASQLVRKEKVGEKTSFRLIETADAVEDGRVAALLEVVKRDASAAAGVVRSVELAHGDEAYLGGYLTLPKGDAPPWILCMLLPRDEVMGAVDRNNLITAAIAAASLLAALGLGVLLSRRLADPVRSVALRSAAIGRLELDQPPLGGSPVKEVHLLMRATDKMTQSLRSFQKYVPTEIVRDILDSGEQARLGARLQELTVLFSDIAGFTSIAEALTPPELVRQLGEYLEEMTQAIREQGGTVDKYIGDAVVAFWGAPRPYADHALAACRSALACQKRLRELRLRWEQEGRPIIHARIGLSTGEMLVGNLGSPTRLDYTVLGENAQLAEHLEALNKTTGTEILISEATFRAVEGRVQARRACETVLEGGRVEQAYELLGLIEEEA
jgi:adenylate cyclase